MANVERGIYVIIVLGEGVRRVEPVTADDPKFAVARAVDLMVATPGATGYDVWKTGRRLCRFRNGDDPYRPDVPARK